jgi:AcrR family transcriptional regulator
MTEEQESRQKILDAAFADKGFRGATIKSIAHRAGLQSPSLIYWYFPTKEYLFQAIVESRSPFTEAVLDPTGSSTRRSVDPVGPRLTQFHGPARHSKIGPFVFFRDGETAVPPAEPTLEDVFVTLAGR